MCQLFFVGYYFCSNIAAEYVVVTFGLRLEDAFDSFEEVQMKIKQIEDRTAMQFYKYSGFPRVLENLENNKFSVLEFYKISWKKYFPWLCEP